MASWHCIEIILQFRQYFFFEVKIAANSTIPPIMLKRVLGTISRTFLSPMELKTKLAQKPTMMNIEAVAFNQLFRGNSAKRSPA